LNIKYIFINSFFTQINKKKHGFLSTTSTSHRNWGKSNYNTYVVSQIMWDNEPGYTVFPDYKMDVDQINNIMTMNQGTLSSSTIFLMQLFISPALAL